MASELERLRHIVSTNTYLALATRHAEGAWASVMAYTVCGPRDLYFTSQGTSRHIADLSTTPNIAGVIYDSTETVQERIDCVQFSAVARVVAKSDLREFLSDASHFNSRIYPESKFDGITRGIDVVLVHVQIQEAFVLDQEAFRQAKVDARLPVVEPVLFVG